MSPQGYMIALVCVTGGWLWSRRFGGWLGAAFFLAFCALGILFVLALAVDANFPHRVGRDAIDAMVTGLVWSGFVTGFFGIGTMIAVIGNWISEGGFEK